MSTMSDLLLSISHCEEVEKALNASSHDCHKIVSFQKEEKRHLPEPWNGDINTADILFISSNPSYDPRENDIFPNNLSDNDYIEKFFLTRFARFDYNTNFVRGIKKCASWLLSIDDDSMLKKRICCTNIVHCKSPKQKGVKESCKKCSEKWLAKVLQEFHGEYIVVLGAVAQTKFEKYIECQKKQKKTVFYLPHPNRWRWLGTDEVIMKKYFVKQ